jgi:riboflavin-specific deaminase-like protein
MKTILSINMAMTLDGKVTRPDGKWYGLSSREDKKRMDKIRSEHDALLLGKNSILNDDPVVHLRYEEGNDPRAVILIRNGTIPKTKKVFKYSNKKPIIVCLENNYKEIFSELGSVSEIIALKETELEPELVVKEIHQLGYSKILLEGGPTLNYSFFKKDLVTDIFLTLVPFLVGQNNLPSIVNGNQFLENFDKEKWMLQEFEKKGNELFLHYQKISIE